MTELRRYELRRAEHPHSIQNGASTPASESRFAWGLQLEWAPCGYVSCVAGLAGTNVPSYSANMRLIWLLLLCVIVLAFGGMVYAAYLSWRRMSAGKRIVGVLLLSPHFLLVVCIVVSLMCGHPAQGSPCFNAQFLCGVLMVFILPLPTLAGTLTALVMFKRARVAL
jgi:hypothetical protein